MLGEEFVDASSTPSTKIDVFVPSRIPATWCHWPSLVIVSAAIAVGVAADVAVTAVVVGGLVVFGVVFAVNSSLHSYLILAYSKRDDDVALDVGFYYSANAAGRLSGTIVSGAVYQAAGLGKSGLLTAQLKQLGRLPTQGDTLDWNGYRFTVSSASQRGAELVSIVEIS